ncbi:hypothetical protein GCM10023321_50420 [Pseudonocardia eucalypti]|uniref:RDD family protein n=1 Tax=Pseudonocardia eucalypti TaxID=648755 RepID=A0ABP9QKG6_9PSEU
MFSGGDRFGGGLGTPHTGPASGVEGLVGGPQPVRGRPQLGVKLLAQLADQAVVVAVVFWTGVLVVVDVVVAFVAQELQPPAGKALVEFDQPVDQFGGPLR